MNTCTMQPSTTSIIDRESEDEYFQNCQIDGCMPQWTVCSQTGEHYMDYTSLHAQRLAKKIELDRRNGKDRSQLRN